MKNSREKNLLKAIRKQGFIEEPTCDCEPNAALQKSHAELLKACKKARQALKDCNTVTRQDWDAAVNATTDAISAAASLAGNL